MKKKIAIGIIALGIAGAGVGVFAYNNHVEALELERIEKVKKENYEKAEATILSLYNKDKTSLAENWIVNTKLDNFFKVFYFEFNWT